MATVATTPSGIPATAPAAQRLRRAIGLNPLAAAGIVLVVIFTVLAIFAPWIAPHDPADINLPDRLSGPSAAHWLGTDEERT